MTGRRYPLEPLLTAAGAGTVMALATRLGKNHSQVFRWRREGMTERAADGAAIALGLHPALVWAEWESAVEFLRCRCCGHRWPALPEDHFCPECASPDIAPEKIERAS